MLVLQGGGWGGFVATLCWAFISCFILFVALLLCPVLLGKRELVTLFVCVEVLRPSQPNGVMSSAVSLPNHTFTNQYCAHSLARN